MSGGYVWGETEVGLSVFCLQALKLKWCLEDLKEVKGRVLEIGCGGGAMSRAVARYRPDLRVTGGDIDQAALAAAKSHGGPVDYRMADAAKLPFKDGEFSAVIGFDVLEHLADADLAIREVGRVLEKGGQWHFYVPLEKGKTTLYYWLSLLGWKAKREMIGHIQTFDSAGLKRLFMETGMKTATCRYGGHWLFQIFDCVYFIFWRLLGKRPMTGKRLLSWERVFSPLFNLESLVLQKVPAGGVSLGGRKG